MRHRASSVLLVSAFLAACAGGSGGARPLGHTVPSVASTVYVVGDTLTIELQVPGQTLQIGARSAATYALRYAPSDGSMRVTADIEALAADVTTSLTEPMSMDREALEGPFTFEVDERGRVSAMSSPAASDLGGQVFASSAPVLAHALFPRLPNRTVAAGDMWTDSVEYRQESDAGRTELRSSLTYTVLGSSTRGGRSLLEIGFTGTAVVAQELNLEGASLTHSSESEVDGRMLWDEAAGLLYESELSMSGPGSVRAALLPAALPARVTWRTRVRLQEP